VSPPSAAHIAPPELAKVDTYRLDSSSNQCEARSKVDIKVDL
jgi:hypothetical protein